MTLKSGPDFLPDLRPTHADLLYAHGLLLRHLLGALEQLAVEDAATINCEHLAMSLSCFTSLPQELLENICLRLDPSSLSAFACCSRLLRLCVSHGFLWKILAIRECALLPLDLSAILRSSLQWKRAALYLQRHRSVYRRAIELTSSLQAILCDDTLPSSQRDVIFTTTSGQLCGLFASLGLPAPFRVRVGRASLFRDISSQQLNGRHFALALMPADSSLFVSVQAQLRVQSGFYAPYSPLCMTIIFDRAYPNVNQAEVAVLNGVWSPLTDSRTGLMRIAIPAGLSSISPLSFVLGTLVDAFTNPLVLTETCQL